MAWQGDGVHNPRYALTRTQLVPERKPDAPLVVELPLWVVIGYIAVFLFTIALSVSCLMITMYMYFSINPPQALRY